MTKSCLFMLLALGCPWLNVAHAAIYKTIDADGNITYSNVPIKGAIKLDIDPPSSSPAGKAEKPARSNKTPTPAGFPRVDSQTQNVRDDKRKQILASELETEQKALQEAKKAYVENAPKLQPKEPGGQASEALQRLQADVSNHESNVQLLQKELATLK